MAFLDENSLFQLRGRVGDLVFKRYGNRTIVCQAPQRTPKPTDRQKAYQQRFAMAAHYASMVTSDPVRTATYTRLAPELSVRQAAMRDYLKPPEITAVEAESFDGRPGSRIRISARDDTVVTQVTIALRTLKGDTIETGPATADVAGWEYRLQSRVQPGRCVVVTATARDLAGAESERVVRLRGR